MSVPADGNPLLACRAHAKLVDSSPRTDPSTGPRGGLLKRIYLLLLLGFFPASTYAYSLPKGDTAQLLLRTTSRPRLVLLSEMTTGRWVPPVDLG